jgi:hypothetical protein
MGGTKPARILVQARDRQLLDAVLKLGAVDRDHAKILGPFGSTTRANARLLSLTQAGLLARTYVGTINGGRRAVYLPPGRRRASASGRASAWAVVEHQLAVAEIYVAFCRVRLFGERPDWQTFSQPLLPGSRLIPDGLLTVHSPAGDLPLFVEADRGTEPVAVWRAKAAKYVELALSGHHQEICGPRNFHVVVTAPDKCRAEAIARTIASVTSKLFWITTAEAVISGAGGAPVWLRPDGSRPNAVPWMP